MPYSREGRRMRAPVPRWVSGLGAAILFCYGGVFAIGSAARVAAPLTGPVTVTYLIDGHGRADVALELPGGRREEMKDVGLPLHRDIDVHAGQPVSVIATAAGGLLVRCEMQIKGETVAADTNHIASCTVTPGDRSTYRPAPMGPAMELAQSDDIMKLPRYPGKSSPVIGRLTDRAAGLSYARLGGGWASPSREQLPGAAGRTLSLWVESRPERGWFALYGSDRLSPELFFSYKGERRLFQAAMAQMETFTWIYSPDTIFVDLVSQPLTVDGREAWVLVRQTRMGAKADTAIRSELQTLVLIDTGKERPAYLYVRMPDPAQDYLPDVNRLISSIRVL
ncbi:hypothetical protein [Microbispora sp. NPDC046933]|uniref:hypothetical protein n=1 Tax=Microbispora sp. NPDC046933 TaxID=3155618 RepID=UPI0033E8DF67